MRLRTSSTRPARAGLRPARATATRRGIGSAATFALVAGVLGVGAAGVSTTVLATPADAAARVTVTPAGGATTIDPDYATTVSLRGSGFQSIPQAFGGVYVFFGTVSDAAGGSWAPSRGGHTGSDYKYVPDSEQADNAGFQRFVTFPGSETAYAANGGELAADGTWSAQLVIPGATFQAQDRSGATVTVDCRAVQCGIITIGAHGVINANNESFTPVSFGGAATGGEQAATGAATGAGQAEQNATDAPADRAEDAAGPTTATLGVDKTTAVAGRAMTFAAQGFTPGEQVVGVLDNGRVAVGPLNAGNAGEVAGILELPADLRLGTHTLKLSGAASGQEPVLEFTVTRDPADAAAAEAAAKAVAAADDSSSGYTPAEIALAAAVLLVLSLIISSAVTGVRRRSAARKAAAATAAGAAPSTPPLVAAAPVSAVPQSAVGPSAGALPVAGAVLPAVPVPAQVQAGAQVAPAAHQVPPTAPVPTREAQTTGRRS